MKKHKKSLEFFKEAKKVLPGGVNSPVRAFKSVNASPLIIKKGKGAYIYDVDGNRYLDFVGSYGPLILGHQNKKVIKEVQNALKKGTTFGATCPLEIALAQKIKQWVPSIEKIRMVNSGTEATMSAIRLARGVTKREKIIKFEGCYHGHADFFLIKAGSGALSLGKPSSLGVTEGNAKDTLIARFNDLKSVEALFEKNKQTIAAIIVEPIAGNMGVVLPKEGFLEGLRKISKQNKSLLIFDEVMTGFRMGTKGAGGLYKVNADLSVFGKIIGGGFPVGAYGGKASFFKDLAPEGGIYQAGTLSGNPIAMAAGLASLEEIERRKDFYARLNTWSFKFEETLTSLITQYQIPASIQRIGSMMTIFFTSKKPTFYEEVLKSNLKLYEKFFKACLQTGIYLPPSQYESFFISFPMIMIRLKTIKRKFKLVFERMLKAL